MLIFIKIVKNYMIAMILICNSHKIAIYVMNKSNVFIFHTNISYVYALLLYKKRTKINFYDI